MADQRRQQPPRDRRGGRGSRDEQTPGLGVPSTAGEPIGRDRARKRVDAPVRRASADDEGGPKRPPLPDDEEPGLPRAIQREIERALGKGPKSRDIALCLSIGSQAIDEERPDVAVDVLAWARHQAPRLAPIREAYGIALYQQERWADALSELQAYRRMTGRVDQNHVIADCVRALDRGFEQVAEAAQALVEDEQAPENRRAEAAIVWAAGLADEGDVGAGRAVLRRFLERPRSGDAEHDLRARYLAAELAEQAGDLDEAARQLELIVAIDEHFLEAADRLEGLRELGG
ncbi:MAG: hypothetical protein WD638_01940 [Nitriliruptoraceae bacterium]